MADQPKSPFEFDISKFFDFGKMMDFGKMQNFGKGMDFTKMFGGQAMSGMPGMSGMAGGDITKMFGNFKVPGVDMTSLMSSQRKNMEALTKANQLALEGMQAVFKRQAEILRQSIEETSAATRDMSSGSGSPQDKVAKQTDLAKATFEKALANARELSEIVAKANGEAIELLNKRFAAMLDEFKESVAKGK